MSGKKPKTYMSVSDPAEWVLEPDLTIQETMLSKDQEIPSLDWGIPPVVDYSDRDPREYVLTGTLGREQPEGSLRRHFRTLDECERWAVMKFGPRARLSTKCRVLKTAVKQGRVKLNFWQLWVLPVQAEGVK